MLATTYIYILIANYLLIGSFAESSPYKSRVNSGNLGYSSKIVMIPVCDTNMTSRCLVMTRVS